MMKKRIMTTEMAVEDSKMETSLRPLSLNEYIGQEKAKAKLYALSANPECGFRT